MDTAHLHELIQLEHHYWWHVAKRRLILQWIHDNCPPPARVLEGGIGGGVNLLELQRQGYQVTGLDLLDQSVEHARQLGLSDVYQHDLLQPWPAEAQSQDLVVMLDVLEHLEDPVLALQHAASVLRSDGRILMTVPAYQWLYGDWDRALGHYRRYTGRMLRTQVEQAGLKLEAMTYWNAFSLPAAVAVRMYQRISPQGRAAEFPRVHPLTNRLLLQVAAVERWCTQRVSLPCGLSLLGVLRK